jgi:hypothetical protein
VVPTPRQQEWLKATLEQRISLAERLGEDGAQAFAESRGWHPLLHGDAKSLPQGPDQVWRSADGVTHVIEAKGGSSQLSNAYGYRQGTPEWAVKSAERVLKSPQATAVEREAAGTVLKAAAKGQLEVQVVRTSHVLGEPVTATLEQSLACTGEATKLAQAAIDDLVRSAVIVADRATQAPVTAAQAADEAVKGAAGRVSTPLKVMNTASKGVIIFAFGVDAALRIKQGAEIEREYHEGAITAQEREVKQARNAAGMAGGWGGAIVGAKLGGMGGAAAGTAVAPGPGTAVGGAAGAVAGGVAGYWCGEAAAEKASEWAVSQVHQTGTTVADVSHSAWEKTTAAAKRTSEAALRASRWPISTVGSTWDAASGKAKNAWHWLAD